MSDRAPRGGRAAARACAALALCAACVPAPVRLEVPPLEGARTAVYTVEVDGAAPLIHVVEPAGEAPALPELPRRDGEAMRLGAVHYACPARVLGLEPGSSRGLPAGEGHPLPPFGVVRVSTADDRAWSAAASAPAVRVRRSVGCARFEEARVAIPDTHAVTSSTSFEGFVFPTFGVVTGPLEVVVAVSDGRFFRVTPDGATPLAPGRGTPYLAYHRAPDGSLWLYGPGGRLSRGDFERGFEVQPYAPRQEAAARAWLSGPTDPAAPFELFALDDSGAVQRFDGAAWTELDALRPPPGDGALDPAEPRQSYGGVAWVGPGEAVVVSEWVEPALRYRVGEGAPTREWPIEPNPDGRTSLRAVRHLPTVGTAIGTAGGRLFLAAPGARAWSQVRDSPLVGVFSFVPAVMALAPLDEGLLFGGGLGRFTQYQPERAPSPWCDFRETMPVEGLRLSENLADFIVTAVEALPCGYVLLSKQSAISADVEVIFLTRIP